MGEGELGECCEVKAKAKLFASGQENPGELKGVNPQALQGSRGRNTLRRPAGGAYVFRNRGDDLAFGLHPTNILRKYRSMESPFHKFQ